MLCQSLEIRGYLFIRLKITRMTYTWNDMWLLQVNFIEVVRRLSKRVSSEYRSCLSEDNSICQEKKEGNTIKKWQVKCGNHAGCYCRYNKEIKSKGHSPGGERPCSFHFFFSVSLITVKVKFKQYWTQQRMRDDKIPVKTSWVSSSWSARKTLKLVILVVSQSWSSHRKSLSVWL